MTDETKVARKPRRQKLRPTSGSPHSWEIKTWPEAVWPHTGDRARWLLRAYRRQLVACGAITRIGTTLIVLSRGYTTWLERNSQHVDEYRSNNPTIGNMRRLKQESADAAG